MLLLFRDDATCHPIDVSGLTLSAQVRQPDGTLVAQLTIAKQAALGEAIASAADTSQWPAGRLQCDIRAQQSGQTAYSQTFAITVGQQVTQ